MKRSEGAVHSWSLIKIKKKHALAYFFHIPQNSRLVHNEPPLYLTECHFVMYGGGDKATSSSQTLSSFVFSHAKNTVLWKGCAAFASSHRTVAWWYEIIKKHIWLTKKKKKETQQMSHFTVTPHPTAEELWWRCYVSIRHPKHRNEAWTIMIQAHIRVSLSLLLRPDAQLKYTK